MNFSFRLSDHCGISQTELAAIKLALDVMLRNAAYTERCAFTLTANGLYWF